MQKVKEISHNTFEIGAASLYTSIKRLLNAELLELQETKSDDKKIYQITEKGIALKK